MSTIPLLPSLKESQQVDITSRGQWGFSSLGRLAASLNVTAKEESNISSIPDIWALPAAFDMILLKKTNHQMHSRFLEEWRGILAILALRGVLGISDLKVHSMIIPSPENLKKNDTALMKLFSRMLPEEFKIFKDPTVKEGFRLQVISYKKNPLAIVWPTLLICPAAAPGFPSEASIPWWGGEGITDPLKLGCLNDHQKIILDNFLRTLSDSLISNLTAMNLSFDSPLSKKIGDLTNLLQEYRKDLQIEDSNSSRGFTDAPDVLDIRGFCSELGKAKILTMDNKSFLDASDVLLEPLSGTKAKNVLVLVEKLHEQWKKSPSDITVAGSYSYETVWPKGTNVPSKHKIANIDLKDYALEIWTPDDFFTEKICIIPQPEPIFPNARINFCENFAGKIVNILPPIKEKVLQYMTPEEITSNIRIKTSSSNNEASIEVELTVSTSGGAMVVKKTYHQNLTTQEDSSIYSVLRTPMLQIWPNFKLSDNHRADWNYYYSFYDNMAFNTFYATPYCPDENPPRRDLDTNRKTELVKTKTYPSAYICKITEKTNIGTKDIQIGLIFPNPPKELTLSMTTKKASIGIDFGTTNTVAYISIEGDNGPKPITLHNYIPGSPEKSMICNLIDHSNDDQEIVCQSYGRKNFIAMSEQPAAPATSIRTIFHHHGGSVDISKTLPLFRGNINSQDSKDSILKDIGIIQSLQTDAMKWDPNQADGMINLESFLLQLGMQCMAEALAQEVANIDWYYSYPTSFSASQKEDLQTTWEKIMTIFTDIYPKTNKQVTANSESIAMARYFAGKESCSIPMGILCLDIGGGSTDIAVWQGGDYSTKDIHAQSSLRFAGKNILNDQLLSHSEILKDFPGEDNSGMNEHLDKLYTMARQRKSKEFNILLEAFLKYYEDPLFARLSVAKSNPKVRIVLRNITLALSGIFYYSGMILGDLRATGNYGEYRHLPDIYVGGNGSKLLKWAAGGNFAEYSQVYELFKEAFADGVDRGHDFDRREAENMFLSDESQKGYNMLFTIKCTEHPKEEVAYGLVSDSEITEYKDDNNQGLRGARKSMLAEKRNEPKTLSTSARMPSGIIAGEKFKVRSTDKAGLDLLTAEDIATNTLEIDETLPFFKEFLSEFNERAEALDFVPITLTDRQFYEIWATVNTQLTKKVKESGGVAKKIAVEPLFIMVLKECLKMI